MAPPQARWVWAKALLGALIGGAICLALSLAAIGLAVWRPGLGRSGL